MKKILAVIGAVLVVLIAALLIIPSLIDWNGYKAQVSQAVRDATGRELVINGDLSMSLLPSPALSADEVALSNVAGAQDANMVSISEVRVSVAMMPLLTGTVKVTEISLIDPVISIETFDDGTNNLVFDPSQAPRSGPDAGMITTPESEQSTAPETQNDTAAEPATDDIASSDDFSSSIQVDRLEIENATIIYRAPGSEERIEGLTVGISADSLNGPLDGEGYVFYRGIPLTFSFDVGQISQTSPFPVSAKIGIDKVDGGISVGGKVDLSSNNPGFDGQIEGKFDDLRKAAQRVAGEDANIPDIAAKPFDLGGHVTANAKSVTLNDLSIRFGETRGSGAIAIDQEPRMRADVALRFNQLDLDSILVLANVGDGENASAGNGGSDGSATSVDAPNPDDAQSIPSQSSGKSGSGKGPIIPADLTASIDFEVETLIYNQTPVHNARINAAIADSKVTLNEVSAGLPGGTDLAVFGSISGEKSTPSAALSYEIASENIRAVFRWLGVDVDAVRADRLRRFSLTGGIKGTPEQLNISNLDMRIDDTAIRGAVVANMSGSGLPALGLGLKLDRINLDQYLPSSPAATDGKSSDGSSGTAGSGSSSSDGGTDQTAKTDMVKLIKDALAPLNGVAANYRLSADEIISSGVSVRGITVNGSINGPKIELTNLAVANAAGLSASAKGTFNGAADVPTFDGLTMRITAKTLEPLVKLTGISLPAPASSYKSVQANLALNGPMTGPKIDLDVSNPLAQVSVKGVLANIFGDNPGLDGTVGVQASSMNRALDLVAPDYNPSGNLGRLALSSKVKGTAQNIDLNDLRLVIGAFETAGNVKFDATQSQPKVTVSLSGGTLAVDPFLPGQKRAGLMPGAGSGPRKAAFNLPQNTHITRVDARDGTPWDDTVIDVSALRSIDADITVKLDRLDFDTYHLIQPDLKVDLVGGLMTISKLNGVLGDGNLAINGNFDARTADVPKLALKGTLDGARIEKLTPIQVANDMVIGGVKTNFDVSAQGNTSRRLVSALGGTANFVLNNVRFSNADKRSVEPKLNLQALLRQGPESMVVEGIGNNDLLETLEADIKITNGIAKTTRVVATSRVGTADADATLDLPKWVMDTRADFDFSEKINEVPPFSVFAKGKIDDPAISGRMDKVAVKVLDNLLDKALGGDEPGEDPKKDAAKGLLKGLLNQFGR
ncbi:AsmA family protein [Thalassospira lucentensis]|uniref:AsmA family protein n=1 Tax=Thalassospira lucentensis TaxID=168935 RepID=UPI00142E214A|nr:AsmA family protein [Thalassospira lucentensis]NIZ02789.1 AsmA family protein [Thalassospira lucentensis]